MAYEIRLPPLGQTADEMSIVEWYKNVGDKIDLAEPLLCVETDKAQVDVESAEEGVVLAILAKPGELLASGTLIAWVGEPGEVLEAARTDAGAEVASAGVEPQATPAPSQAIAVPSDAPQSGKTRVSPVVRKLAADLGVDLSSISGSGAGGLIQRADVEAAAQSPGQSALNTSPDVHHLEVPALRRAIARRLTKSVQTIPQFSLRADLDATLAKRTIASAGGGLTYTHLVLRNVARALREHPTMLRIWDDNGPTYRTLSHAHVGMAVAGDDSLYVVTIPEPDVLGVSALVGVVAGAAERGRMGTLSKDDQLPAAIAVSNLGMFGVESFEAIIDPDQTAILAVGAVRDSVVSVDGEMRVAPTMTVNLSCDHRSVDGAQAAKFLRTFRTYFETDPAGPSSSSGAE
jgi:pyruvate dehydrogenase E2 component (dihydrolipoamide acetyltransferase)